MSEYREPSEPARSGDTEGKWVDFPTSPDPDPWAALLRKAYRLPTMLIETQQAPNVVPAASDRATWRAPPSAKPPPGRRAPR
jgi:hypothetical protein